MSELKDSGARRDFGTGAVRDAAEGKGRCDLLPLKVVGDIFNDAVFVEIGRYVRNGNLDNLFGAILCAADGFGWDTPTAILEVSKQYEDGCQKYGDRNWEKGIPLHCYIDSGVRHYLKFLRGDTDEPHDRAFLWNMLGAIWTHENKPELIDLPFAVVGNPTTPETEGKPVEPWGEEDEARKDRLKEAPMSDKPCPVTQIQAYRAYEKLLEIMEDETDDQTEVFSTAYKALYWIANGRQTAICCSSAQSQKPM